MGLRMRERDSWVNSCGSTNNRRSPFLYICWSFESTSVVTTNCHCILHMHEPSGHLPLMKSSKFFFLTDCAPIIELPPLHLLSIMSIFFKASYIFLSQARVYNRVHQLHDGRDIAFSSYLCCWWLRLHAPRLGLFLASIWLNNLSFQKSS